jgi:signal transduction histidine kinase
MTDVSLRAAIFFTAALFALITGFIIYFVVLYRNKQLANKRVQEQLQAEFQQELLKTQIEIQEQTLSNISAEIHDNITQVLSFVKLNLALVDSADGLERKQKITDSRELLAQTISDLRDLSKSLSFEHIKQLGLYETMQLVVEIINKSGLVKVDLEIQGDQYFLGEQSELVLFRIFQEGVNNSLKYSNSNILTITLQYLADLFTLTVQDDGDGFSIETLDRSKGMGLKNIENRAALIGAVATIDSLPGKGCCIKVTFSPEKQILYTDGKHQDRFSG